MDQGTEIGLLVAGCVVAACLVVPCVVALAYYCCAPRVLFDLLVRRSAKGAALVEKSVDCGEGSVRLPRVRWSYYEGGLKHKGVKPTLLFLHGFSADKGATVSFLHALTPHFHVVAPDMVGHGKTRPVSAQIDEAALSYLVTDQVDRLHQFVEAVLPRVSINLAGISMGGHISGLYATRYPAMIRSLGLFCPHGVAGDHVSLFLNEIYETRGRVLECTTSEHAERLTDYIFHKKPWVPGAYYRVVIQEKHDRSAVLARIMDDLLQPPNDTLLQSHLHLLHLPVWIGWGRNDKILDVSCVKVLQTRIPGPKQVHIYDETGHALIVERAHETSRDFLAWLNSLTTTGSSESTPLLSEVHVHVTGGGGSGEVKEAKEHTDAPAGAAAAAALLTTAGGLEASLAAASSTTALPPPRTAL